MLTGMRYTSASTPDVWDCCLFMQSTLLGGACLERQRCAPRMQAAFTRYGMEWAENGQPACAPGANLSTWNGVICTNGHVSALVLHYSSLYGPLSSALGNLTQLDFLILDSNALTGAFLPTTSRCLMSDCKEWHLHLLWPLSCILSHKRPFISSQAVGSAQSPKH